MNLIPYQDIDLQAVKSYAKRLADGEVNVKFGLYGNIDPAVSPFRMRACDNVYVTQSGIRWLMPSLTLLHPD